MKKLNKKGFTLIELLAVIVILALLVAVAIPAVTKYLNTSRKGVFADNAAAAISAVRNDVIADGVTTTRTYIIDGTNTEQVDDPASQKYYVNNLLEKKLKNSPFGKPYKGTIVVKYDPTTSTTSYKIFLTDTENCLATYTPDDERTASENEEKVDYIYENLINDDAIVVGKPICDNSSMIG